MDQPSGPLQMEQFAGTAVSAPPEASDQIELERIEPALFVEHGVVDMRQQHFGEDQVTGGTLGRVWLDLRLKWRSVVIL